MYTTAVIVGAGQAGLAMSSCLTRRGIDHVVLERGRVGERWRSERWDSLRLLTPNWMTRLPGFEYAGPDPDGFMSMANVADYFAAYAESFDAPVIGETSVFAARRRGEGYELETSTGVYRCTALVAATGAAATPNIPEIASAVPANVAQVSPKYYRRPEQLADGGVLVVGASASGIQLAREIHLSGRPVTLAVGRHTRMPRTYRGVDIHRWLDRLGALDRNYDSFADLEAARREPSLQLVGTTEGRDVDLVELQRIGVTLVGRLDRFSGNRARFDRSLRSSAAAADRAQRRLLDRIDRWAHEHDLDGMLSSATRPAALVPDPDVDEIDLRGVGTVLWATGYRPDFSWLDLPVVGRDGAVPHDGGVVTGSPGLYLMGLPLMRTRKSTYIDGVGADAEALAEHLAAGLDRTAVGASTTVAS